MLSTKYWWTCKNNLPPFNSGTLRYPVWRKFRVCFSVSLSNFGLATHRYFETMWGRDRDLRLYSYIILPNVHIPIEKFLSLPPCIVKVDPWNRSVWVPDKFGLATYRFFEFIWGWDRYLVKGNTCSPRNIDELVRIIYLPLIPGPYGTMSSACVPESRVG